MTDHAFTKIGTYSFRTLVPRHKDYVCMCLTGKKKKKERNYFWKARKKYNYQLVTVEKII